MIIIIIITAAEAIYPTDVLSSDLDSLEAYRQIVDVVTE